MYLYSVLSVVDNPREGDKRSKGTRGEEEWQGRDQGGGGTVAARQANFGMSVGRGNRWYGASMTVRGGTAASGERVECMDGAVRGDGG